MAAPQFMHLIVSTPQGEAEISVNAVHESVTLADLLGRVLTSGAPNIVYVDGRPTPIGTLMGAAGLVIGSVIETVAPPPPASESGITLVQAAGDGGGSRQSLAPGRYTVGTARRANVAPLTFNEVLVPRCQVAVEHSGRVTVAASQGDLDGYSAVNPARWSDEHLRIGHRVFRLETSVEDRAASLLPTSMGRLSFTRRPRPETVDALEPQGQAQNGGRLLRRRRAKSIEAQSPAISIKDPAELAFDVELAGARHAHLDVADVVRRAERRSERLWERRPADEDAFLFSVGLADQPRVDLDPAHGHRRDLAMLPSSPVIVELAKQRGVGFVGTPPQARAAARALVMQACVLHSPADLDVVVLTTGHGARRWEWVKWLPHATGSRGAQVFTDDETIADWIAAQRTLTSVVASIQSLYRPITLNRLTLAVVDDPELWRGRSATLRGLFADAQLPVRFTVLTDRADDVPAVCTTVVRIAANGAAEVDYLTSGRTISDVVPMVLDHDVALTAARQLSALEDQSAQSSGTAVLPPLVALESLLDPDGLDADRIAQRWGAGRRNRRPRIPLGTAESGLLELELHDDGPHVLILGAERSGKTALLRSIIVSLMASMEPSALNVVCVEPGHGSFGLFSGASHVVGLVDELDEHSGARALRALRSEVRRRARLLGECHAATLDEYTGRDSIPTIPRLAIVVDGAPEVVARDSTFLPQLIDLVEHSRHVGLHLIVSATHLPPLVEQSLKSIANVRIALRMNDPIEATAFMGTRHPVQISVHTPGRGLFRIGDDPPIPVQFTSPTAASGDLIEVTPFVVARDLNAAERRVIVRSDELGGRGTLRALVDVIAKAAAQHGHELARPVVLPELPTELRYDQLPPMEADPGAIAAFEAAGAPFALSDLPDDLTQSTRRWNPARDGNVLVIGGSPKERSGALATMLIAGSDRYPLDHFHFYVVDAAPSQHGSLRSLESLPACGAVATSDDFDRMLRVLVRVDAEVQRRSAGKSEPSDPHIVLVVNDVGSLMRSLELDGEFEHGRDLVERIVGNGPAHGITALMSSPNEHVAPSRTLSQVQQRIILHLDDRGAYHAMGIDSGLVPDPVHGRAITTPELVEIQIATIDDLAAVVGQRADRSQSGPKPLTVPKTPSRVPFAEVFAMTAYDQSGWRLPVGLDARTLRPGVLELPQPSGALILGDRGSGKSDLLMNIALGALGVEGPVEVHAIASTWSPLLLLPGLSGAATFAGIQRWITAFSRETDRARLILIDDAERLEGAAFERLAELGDPTVTVVVAGRIRDLEEPTHWTAPLRRSKAAVILRPFAGDGAMFDLNLRVGPSHLTPGRGVLITGATVVPILLAAAPDHEDGEAP